MKVAQALGHLGCLLGSSQRRQQHPGQNGNNGDDDQQFDESERGGFSSFHCCFVLSHNASLRGESNLRMTHLILRHTLLQFSVIFQIASRETHSG
jgi:hypothetical protein